MIEDINVDELDFEAESKAALAEQELYKKKRVRKRINSLADQGTREGIFSDVVGYLLVIVAKMGAAQPVNQIGQENKDICKAINELIESGELRIPALEAKTPDEVLKGLVYLSNGISAEIKHARGTDTSS